MQQYKIFHGGLDDGPRFLRGSRSRRFRLAVLIGASLLLAGCGSLPDIPDYVNPLTWFEDDEPAQGAAAKKDYPRLSSVPARPSAPSLESQQAKIQQGLIADQRNARYSDNLVRREADRRLAPAARRVPVVPPVARPSVPPPSVARPSVPPPPVVRRSAPPPLVARPSVPPPPVARPAPPVRRPAETQVAARPAVPPVKSAPPLVTRAVPTRQPAPSLGPAGQTIKIGTIYFGDNSNKLQRDDLTILQQIAAVQRNTGATIRIIGHASGRVRTFDPARRAQINYEVSLDRAKSVAAALVGMGVPEKSIQVEGAGDTAPIYAEYTAAGEAANRRAELFMLN
jgi:outer membrane protein OmpA-like peptidoglycan-associated protein